METTYNKSMNVFELSSRLKNAGLKVEICNKGRWILITNNDGKKQDRIVWTPTVDGWEGSYEVFTRGAGRNEYHLRTWGLRIASVSAETRSADDVAYRIRTTTEDLFKSFDNAKRDR